MIRKTPSDFGSHDDWLAHVRTEIPVPEQPYAIGLGRMDLFRSFYRMQGLPFPTQFAEELERIETMLRPRADIRVGDLNDADLPEALRCICLIRRDLSTSIDEVGKHRHFRAKKLRNY